MAVSKNNEQEPVRLVDPDDKTLTLLNADVYNPELGKRENINDSHDNHFNEETSAEFSPEHPANQRYSDDNEEESMNGLMKGKAMGIFALLLSILSLFILPVFLGGAGIIVGFIARRGQAKTIGNWAIGIGIVSIIASLFFRSFI